MSAKIEYLGVDTSNYTTSVALHLSDGMKIYPSDGTRICFSHGMEKCFPDGMTNRSPDGMGIHSPRGMEIHLPDGMESRRKLLPVRPGERGLRQSDAVFLHIKQFPELFETLPTPTSLAAVGVSCRPRWTEDSYMPCFLTGLSIARSLAHSHGCELYRFSHQQGHIAAGLWSSGRTDLFHEKFLAFHVSGGTTELLLVNGIDHIQILSRTLDLHAGQLIDRIGVMLGYPFPCGASMDPDALRGEKPLKHRISLRDGCCSLSGFENKAQKMLRDGFPKEEIAFFAVDCVCSHLEAMIDSALCQYPGLPLLMIGGVCSNSIIRRRLTDRYGAVFAAEGFSCDNAAGIAYLARLRHEGVI